MSSYKYDPKSLKAEEFINHEEILESLDYAQKNKDNIPLMKEILEKAKKAKGISHKEAAVLMECEDPEINRQIKELAMEIKEKFYGHRIVMFAPLYLSNYCVNAHIAHIIIRISISRVSNLRRNRSGMRLLLCRIWGISVLLLNRERIR